ncbi:MAG: SDR family oxidoreductase [Rhizobiaceae bacterium]|nr:SDR family oxidoreductase [Rhizobiaceae bacterium]
MRLLILGAGYSGKAIARECGPDFASAHGTTRSADTFGEIRHAGAEPLVFDGSEITPALAEALREATHLVQSISPAKEGDGFLRLVDDLASVAPNLRWIGYLSTIGVYGNRNGAWVDEDADLEPVNERSRERVAAERNWRARGAGMDIPVAVLRLSGIYGPGRNAFVNLANGTARRLIKPGQIFNRIRVEDIGRFCRFLIGRDVGGVYNVTDAEPGPPQDVIEYAARLMGVPVPPDIPFETAELSPMARSFYGESKRVSNARARALGFDFLYPDYRVSLEQMWNDQSWRSVQGQIPARPKA